MWVGDLHLCSVAAEWLKLGAVWSGEATGTGGEQPRQRRDVPELPDGAGPASETGRWTRGTSDVKLLKTSASSNPVDLGWIAVRTLPPFRVGNSWAGLVLPAGRPR